MFSIFVLLSFTEKPAKKLFFLWEVARLLNAFPNAGIFSWEFSLLHMHTYIHILKCNKQSDCFLFLEMSSFKKCKNEMHTQYSYTLQNSLKAKQVQNA